MKKLILIIFFALLLVLLVGCNKEGSFTTISENQLSHAPENGPTLKDASIPAKYIVVLQKDPGISGFETKEKKDHITAKAIGLLKKYEITSVAEEVYESALEGFSVKMVPGQLAKLQQDPQIKFIEADQKFNISAKRTTKPAPVPATSQSTPWGITRVGGGATYTGTNVAWVIDTGILLTHPDLNVDQSRGISFVTGITSPNDDNGHGTHVAGTIAAINNTFGVVGVAAGARVVPVKVMDSSGSGTTSAVLAGINYVMTKGQAGDVVNLSIGGEISAAIDDAVFEASSVFKIAIAAGNESDFASNYSPGRVNGSNVYTVSAMDSNGIWAYFSNYGNATVDYCAPGMTILSTYKNGDYIAISGTSMAAPHVAGLLLLGSIRTDGYVTKDPDGLPDPIAHR